MPGNVDEIMNPFARVAGMQPARQLSAWREKFFIAKKRKIHLIVD